MIRVPGWPSGMTRGAIDDVRSGRGLPPLRDPDVRLKALRSALVTVAEELAQATAGDDTEEALEERVGRIAHISSSAVMTIRGELPDVVSKTPMFVRCPLCERFHSPGHCPK